MEYLYNEIKNTEEDIFTIKSKIEVIEDTAENKLEIESFKERLNELEESLSDLKGGSVAKVGQMCALSKIRIYTPRKEGQRFSSFTLDPLKMNDLDNKITELYLKKS